MKKCEDCGGPVRRSVRICLDCQIARAAAEAREHARKGLRRLAELRRRLADWKRGR